MYLFLSFFFFCIDIMTTGILRTVQNSVIVPELLDYSDRIIKSYQNHPSVLKIKNKFGSNLNNFDFQQIKSLVVKKTLKGNRH